MLNWAIIKTAFLKYLKTKQILVFCYTIELAFALVLIFGVSVNVADGKVISISILGGEPIDDKIFIRTFIELVAGFGLWVITFLYIIGSSEFVVDLVKDPLLNLILIKNVSKASAFVSRFIGAVSSYIANVLGFSFIISVIISFKIAHLYLSPVLAALIFSVLFITISFVCSLFSILTGNATISAVFMLVVFFVIEPKISSVKGSLGILGDLIYYLIPRFSSLFNKVLNVAGVKILNGGGFSEPFLTSVLVSILISMGYFMLSVFIFTRKEF